MKKFDCNFTPLNITSEGKEWSAAYAYPTKKELVERLLKEGFEVFVFDSMKELLTWTTE